MSCLGNPDPLLINSKLCADTERKYSHGTWRQTWATSLWMKKKRSAVEQAEGRRAVCQELFQQRLHLWRRRGPHRKIGRDNTKLWLCSLFSFNPPLWLTIFYIIMTQLGLGTVSPAKVLCGRKMCMKWKTTNLLRGFSSSRRSAAIAQISYGKHPVCKLPLTLIDLWEC